MSEPHEKITEAPITRRRFLQFGAAVGAAAAASTALGPSASAAARWRPNLSSGRNLNVICEAGGNLELTPIASLFKKTTGHTVNLIESPVQRTLRPRLQRDVYRFGEL